MKRREFIALIGGAAVTWPLTARAQEPGRMKRIGFVIGLADGTEARLRFDSFRDGLAAVGWTEGRNIEIVARFGAADPVRNQAHVGELLRLSPDVIVTSHGAAASALVKGTQTIPVVIANMTDPVALGFAASLARPGGNVTGFTNFEPATASKWLELLREMAPGTTRFVILTNPLDPSAPIFDRAVEAGAVSIAVGVTMARVRDDAEIEQAIVSIARQPNVGLVVPPGGELGARRAVIVGLTAQHRLPAIYSARDRVLAGGLMSYGPEVLDLYRRPAEYVDRILKGAKAAELPIQQPTKFELVINLKTARALGLEVPSSLLARADEVIE